MTAIEHAADQWWDIQAGEYVLGSLRTHERALFEQAMSLDANIREQVYRWQQRLAPLNEMTTLIAPPEPIWENVLAHISHQSAQNDPHHNDTNGQHGNLSGD